MSIFNLIRNAETNKKKKSMQLIKATLCFAANREPVSLAHKAPSSQLGQEGEEAAQILHKGRRKLTK